jgi:hypothetical protein
MSWTAPWCESEQFAHLSREAVVRGVAQLWMQSRAWIRCHKARFGLFFRVTASALFSRMADMLKLAPEKL